MRKIVITAVTSALALLALQGCSVVRQDRYSLVDLQGGWWSSCGDPAAALLISSDKY